MFREERMCFYAKILAEGEKVIEDVNSTISWMLQHRPIIILFGTMDPQWEFMSENLDFLKTIGLRIIGHDLKRKRYISSQYPEKFSDLRIIEFSDSSREHLDDILSQHKYIPLNYIKFSLRDLPAYFKAGFITKLYHPFSGYRFKFNNVLAYFKPTREHWEKYFATLIELREVEAVKNMDNCEPGCIRDCSVLWMGKNKTTQFGGFIKYDDQTTTFFIKYYMEKYPFKEPTVKCSNISCPPGFYRRYTNTTFGYEWMCEPCPVNHFKANEGNETQCKRCSGVLSIDNGKRTRCIDPYTETPLQVTEERIFVLVLCGIGIFMTFGTMIVFTIKRDSPIVRLSDYKLSMFHMTLICVIFGGILFSLWLVQLIKFGICLMKILIVSIGYVLNVGVLFIKSQKLLKAYLSKVRLSPDEIKRTLYGQVFIIFMFLLAVNGFLFILLIWKPLRIVEVRDSLTMTRLKIYDKHTHMSIIIGLAMVIQLLCSIQAFRGRNLPNLMNDGIVLTYATFALSVVFGVSYAMVYFQKEAEKEIFQLGAVACNNLIISFLIYGQKAIRMLAYPAKNTRRYYNKQRMQAMQVRAKGRIQMSNFTNNNDQPGPSTQ